MVLWLAVFLSDFAINALSGWYYDARDAHRVRRAIAFGAALDIVIGVNTIGFAEMRWAMLIPGVLGGALGTLVSMTRKP